MKEVRYFYVPDAANQVELPVEEATHALRVLRLKGGDEIFLMDGEGSFSVLRLLLHPASDVSMKSRKRCRSSVPGRDISIWRLRQPR